MVAPSKTLQPSRIIEEEKDGIEQVMAEALEDNQLNGVAIYINSDEEYQWAHRAHSTLHKKLLDLWSIFELIHLPTYMLLIKPSPLT